MIRNAVAFEVAHAMENGWKTGTVEQGIPWNVHGQNVELVMDGRHVGNYYLCEQIKIGGIRLDIQDAYEDVLADGKVPATFENCGYLLELDNNYDENYKFITSHYSVPFMFKDDVLSDGILNAVKQTMSTSSLVPFTISWTAMANCRQVPYGTSTALLSRTWKMHKRKAARATV